MNPLFKTLQQERIKWLEREYPNWAQDKKERFLEASNLIDECLFKINNLGFLVVVNITEGEPGKLVNFYGLQSESYLEEHYLKEVKNTNKLKK